MYRKWQHAGFSARWRRRSKVNVDSERQSPTSYELLIITIGLSLFVSNFKHLFVDRKWRHAFYPLGGVSGQMSMRILKGSPTTYLRLIITFGLSLIVSELGICLWTGNDVMAVSPLGGIVGRRSMWILKGSPRLPIYDYLYFWSISYCFRVISICLWTGNDVMPISSLGGVVGQTSVQILKGGPRLPICD